MQNSKEKICQLKPKKDSNRRPRNWYVQERDYVRIKNYLPDSNLKAEWWEPYCRMWSICHLTISLGTSSLVNNPMWNLLLSKSFNISSRQGPENTMVLDLRSLTGNVSSSGTPVCGMCDCGGSGVWAYDRPSTYVECVWKYLLLYM